MKNPIALICFLCLGLWAIPAKAQLIERACGGHMPCSFSQFKTGEFDWFRRADTNHDGSIDASEQAAIWKTYAQDILPNCHDMQDVKALKLNHVPNEDQMRKNFGVVDMNNDGKIDSQEDEQITLRINQACLLLHNPQVQKLKDMLRQLQQGASK